MFATVLAIANSTSNVQHTIMQWYKYCIVLAEIIDIPEFQVENLEYLLK